MYPWLSWRHELDLFLYLLIVVGYNANKQKRKYLIFFPKTVFRIELRPQFWKKKNALWLVFLKEKPSEVVIEGNLWRRRRHYRHWGSESFLLKIFRFQTIRSFAKLSETQLTDCPRTATCFVLFRNRKQTRPSPWSRRCRLTRKTTSVTPVIQWPQLFIAGLGSGMHLNDRTEETEGRQPPDVFVMLLDMKTWRPPCITRVHTHIYIDTNCRFSCWSIFSIYLYKNKWIPLHKLLPNIGQK